MSFHQPYKLQKWNRPTDYIGNDLPNDWSISIMTSCMCGLESESNYKVFLERLGGLSSTVKEERVGFSGDGWYKFIAIHDSNKVALAKAEEMLSSLQDYPILDEGHFAELEQAYYESIGYRQDDSGEWIPDPETEKPGAVAGP